MAIASSKLKPFPSLASMRDAHANLMDYEETFPRPEKLLNAITEFLERGRRTGRFLELYADRSSAQALLDYWVAMKSRMAPSRTGEPSRGKKEDPKTARSRWRLMDFELETLVDWQKPPCPYPSLARFSQYAVKHFAGREKLGLQLCQTLNKNRILAIVGSAGSGKHWLVKAGMIPLLEADAVSGSAKWQIIQLQPGASPLASLAAAINLMRTTGSTSVSEDISFWRKPGSLNDLLMEMQIPSALIVISHFDELLLRSSDCGERDKSERDAFLANLNSLVDSSDEHRLLIVMRANTWEEARRLPYMGHKLSEKVRCQLPPLSAGELRDLIEKPAQSVGVKFETGLVDMMIADIAGDPAALILLQFALHKLWSDLDTNRITIKTYQEMGGAQHALQMEAERTYTEILNEDQRRAARRIMLWLVQLYAGSGVICRSIKTDDLPKLLNGEDPLQAKQTLKLLVESGILTEEDGNVQVVHEGLIVRWPRLLEWLENQGATDRERARLRIATEQWKESQRDRGALWGGQTLIDLEKRDYDDLSDLEKQFIRASRDEKRKWDRIRQAILWCGVSVLMISFIITLSSFFRGNHRLAAMCAERGTWHLTDKFDTGGAALWFADAHRKENWFRRVSDPLGWLGNYKELRLAQASSAMRQMPRLIGQFQQDNINCAEWSPDGRHLIITGSGKLGGTGNGAVTAALWDPLSGKKIKDLVTDGPCTWGAFNDRGTVVAVAQGFEGSDASDLVVWSRHVEDGNMDTSWSEVGKIGLAEKVMALAFAPKADSSSSMDETIAAVIRRRDGQFEVLLWENLNIRDPSSTIPKKCPLEIPVNRLAFHPKDKQVAIACGDLQSGGVGEVVVWNFAKPKSDAEFTRKEIPEPIGSVAFSPDGKSLIAAGGADSDVPSSAWYWKNDGKNSDAAVTMSRSPLTHSKMVRSAVVSPDGTRLLTAGKDGMAQVWDLEKDRISAELVHDGDVWDARFSPDGLLIATGGRDKVVRLWTADAGHPVFPSMNHPGTVAQVTFSPDGRRLLARGKDFVRVWELATGTPPALVFGTPVLHEFNRDSQVPVAHPPEALAPIRPAGPMRHVSLSADGESLLTQSGDGKIRIWKTTGTPGREELRSDSYANLPLEMPALNCDGELVAAIAANPEVPGQQMLVVCDATRKGLLRIDKYDHPIPGTGTEKITRLFFSRFDPKLLALITTNSSTPSGQPDTLYVCNLTHEDPQAPGRPKLTVVRPEMRIRFADFEKGGWLLIGTGDVNTRKGSGEVWKPDGTQVVRTPCDPKVSSQGHTEPVLFMDLSPDRTSFATASQDDTVAIWTLDSPPSRLMEIRGLHSADVTGVRYNGKGDEVLTWSSDNCAALVKWNDWTKDAYTDDKSSAVRFFNKSAVRDARFDQEERKVLTRSSDGIVNVWEPTTGDLIAVLPTMGELLDARFIDAEALGATPPGIVSTLNLEGLSKAASDSPAAANELYSFATIKRWDISADPRIQKVFPVIAVLASRSIDKSHLVQPAIQDLHTTWLEEEKEYFSVFGPSRKGQMNDLDFHQREANFAEVLENWFAVQWHLSKILNDATATPPAEQSFAWLDRAAIASIRLWDYESAVRYYQEELELAEPELAQDITKPLWIDRKANALQQISWCFTEMEKWGDAERACAELIKLVEVHKLADAHIAHMVYARYFCERALASQQSLESRNSFLDKAIEQLKIATESGGIKSHAPWIRLASVQLLRGDNEGYLETFEKSLELFSAASGQKQLDVSWGWVLGPGSADKWQSHLETLKQAVQQYLNASEKNNYVYLNTLGAVLFRAGDFAGAIKALEGSCKDFESSDRRKFHRSMRFSPSDSGECEGRPQDWLFLSMAHLESGNKEEAKRWLKFANDYMTPSQEHPTPVDNTLRRTWNRIDLMVLLEEANKKMRAADAAGSG